MQRSVRFLSPADRACPIDASKTLNTPGALAAGRRRTSADNDTLVLKILQEANGPLGAYDIACRASSTGDKIVPNQVYRTLSRLIEQQSVVRIETLNAYVTRQPRANVCLICSGCQMVEMVDMPNLRRSLVKAAPGGNFETVDGLIEAQGRCVDCRPDVHGG